MDANLHRDLQFISLRTAAAIAFFQLTGYAPDPRDFRRMQRLLDDVAHALAMLAPIYAMDPASGQPTALDEALIVAGRFVRGAAALEMPEGRIYGDLRIQRRDYETAINILRGARLPWKEHEKNG